MIQTEDFIRRWCCQLSLNDLPDVTFVETNPEKILADIIKDYENAYFESTGERVILRPADPIRIFLYTQALREIQLRHVIDETGKQNLLKYAKGNVLDHKGARVRAIRGVAMPSKTRMRLRFSQARPTITILDRGIRFSPGTNIYFETDRSYELPAGEQELIVNVTCTESGVVGNGLLPGQINVIVDPQPYLVDAENIDLTQGGTDIEDDDSYRIKIYNAPEGLSVAGPEAAYEYHAKAYSTLIEDVKVNSPSPGVIDIRVLLKNGELPSAGFIAELDSHFGKGLRPLTDRVQFAAPDVVSYDLDVTYYISSDQIENANEIQERVQIALDSFVIWQKRKIGRDINDSELVFLLRQAGAKRVEVRQPSFTSISEVSVAHANSISLTYGGMESD